MSDAAKYSAVEALRDGRRAEFRALRPDDRADLIAAVGRSSAEFLLPPLLRREARVHGARDRFS